MPRVTRVFIAQEQRRRYIMYLVAAVVAKASNGADLYAALVPIFFHQWREYKYLIRPTTLEEVFPRSNAFPALSSIRESISFSSPAALGT